MGNGAVPTTAAAAIAEMVTPALLILASASLVASALVRMARVVDRVRVLAAAAQDRGWNRLGISSAQLRAGIRRHAERARYAERSIALLYGAVVVFVATCLALAADRILDGALAWVPPVLAIAGTLLLLGGGWWMVAECRLGGKQIAEEIQAALSQMEVDEP
jgi:hypothetical protein